MGTCLPAVQAENILLRGPEDYGDNVQCRCECPPCGWFTSRYIYHSKTTGLFDGVYQMVALRSFGCDPVKRFLTEVISNLESHFSDLYSTDWHQLEEAAEGIFRQHGLNTTLKRHCRDGEAGLLFLSAGSTESMDGYWKNAERRTLDVEAAPTLLLGQFLERGLFLPAQQPS